MSFSTVRQLTIKCRLRRISASCRCNGGGHAHVQAALRPGTAAEVKISAGLDCEAVSPLGSVVSPGPLASCRKPQREHTRSRVASAVLQVSACSS